MVRALPGIMFSQPTLSWPKAWTHKRKTKFMFSFKRVFSGMITRLHSMKIINQHLYYDNKKSDWRRPFINPVMFLIQTFYSIYRFFNTLHMAGCINNIIMFQTNAFFYSTALPKIMSLFLPVSVVKPQLLSWWLRGISKWGSAQFVLVASSFTWLYYLISILKNMHKHHFVLHCIYLHTFLKMKSFVHEMGSCTANK